MCIDFGNTDKQFFFFRYYGVNTFSQINDCQQHEREEKKTESISIYKQHFSIPQRIRLMFSHQTELFRFEIVVIQCLHVTFVCSGLKIGLGINLKWAFKQCTETDDDRFLFFFLFRVCFVFTENKN